MTLHGWLTLVASLGQLALALVVLRARRNPFTLPLALLCLDLAGFNLAALAHDLSGDPNFGLVDLSISPLGVPLTLHVVLVFIGERRRHRRLLTACYVAMGLLALTAATGLFVPAMREFAYSRTFVAIDLAILLPALFLALWLLGRYTLQVALGAERTRGALLLLALGLGGGLAVTDLFNGLGLPIPRLTALGTLLIALTMAVVALRFRLLEGAIARRTTFWSVAAASVLTLAFVATYRLMADKAVILVGASIVLALVVLVAGRSVGLDLLTRRRRIGELATLGRFSAQMAHDLKNPLAAAKGAVEYLREEHAQGRSLDDQTRFLEILEAEIDRIDDVLETYGRLGRMDAERRSVDLNALAREVVDLCAVPETVTVNAELDPDLPPCRADAELLARALTNLVQNAVQAMQGEGTLTVRTGTDGPARVHLEVHDDGPGMDARTRERAFDEFWTTKATGSGLGLGIVQRVAEAHGGEVRLETSSGRGTTVALFLPLG